MANIDIVIGSAFGDEGKGLVTDYLSSRVEGRGCVVRFNGGAQAGHTVHTADGKWHVFSHFGSGTFAGLPTYLSAFFVCNPIVFLREMQELAAVQVKPKVFADPACPVTTPYDIMINQIIEKERRDKRHGSVGVGFGETLERQSRKKYALCLRDLQNPDLLRARLDSIRQQWGSKRLAALGVKEPGEEWRERFASEDIRERFMEDVERFLDGVTLAPLTCLNAYDHLVFEGAQGLLLDQERGWFPYVTRSHTGVRNALHLARRLGVRTLDVHYLTRAYTTRHGEGPLPHALSEPPYENVVDPTNKPNPYQGALRFAWFDLDLFRNTVLRDMGDAKGFRLRPHLGMTCLDQVDDKAGYMSDGVLLRTEPEKLARLAAQAIGANTLLAGYGSTRATVRRSLVVKRKNNPFEAFDVVKNDDVALETHKALLDEGGELLIHAFA